MSWPEAVALVGSFIVIFGSIVLVIWLIEREETKRRRP
jgi:hypothetical protein